MKYHHGNLKENLIDLAFSECEQIGWENISLRNLSKKLNVSQTAPYRHFETKEDLLAEVAAKGFIKLKEGMDKGSDFLETGNAYINFALDFPNTYDLMLGTHLGHFGNYPNLAKAANSTFSDLTLDLKQHMLDLGNEDLSDKNVGEKAISIWALMHGMVGILRKTLVVEEGHGDIGDGIVIAKRIKDDLESFLAKTVDNILSN